MDAESRLSPFYDDMSVRVAEQFRQRKRTAVLAIVFTDIAGSVRLREELGELEYETFRVDYDELVRSIVEEGGVGALVKGTGDGCLAVFDEPSTAVQRCLEIQRATRRHKRFHLRIGIDMGQVSVQSEGGIVQDVFGRHVNRAARIQSLAEPGHVLVSFQIYDCAVGWMPRGNPQWQDHGTTSLRGFTRKVSIHEPFSPDEMKPQEPFGTDQLESESGEIHYLFMPRPVDRPTSARRKALVPLSAASWRGDPFAFYKSAMGKAVHSAAAKHRPIPRILWVDDYPANTASERAFLESVGCTVDTATSTEEGLQALNRGEYAFVITDMGRDGNATAGLDLLRDMTRAGHDVPVIVYSSARALSRHGDEARKIGAILCTAGLFTLLDGVHQLLDNPDENSR